MINDILSVIIENSVEIILAVISAIVAYVVVPWLKSEAIPWLKDNRLYEIVKSYVMAAEKIKQKNNINLDKHNYVIERLRERGLEIDEHLLAKVEQAVIELDMKIAGSVVELFGFRDDENVE